MENDNYKLKKFINNFNFENPRLDNLPEGFPYIDTSGLSRHEMGVLSAIKMVWIISSPSKTQAIENYIYTNKILYGILTSTIINFTVTTLSLFVIIMGAISMIYYLNIRYDWGLYFLIEFFA